MNRLMLLGVALASTLAGAQTTFEQASIRRVDDPTGDAYTFSAGQCGESLNLRWQNNTIFGTPCSDFRIWATSGSCGTEPGTSDLEYDAIPGLTFLGTVRAGTFTVKVSELPLFATTVQSDGGVGRSCGEANAELTHRVCGAISTAQVGSINGCAGAIKTSASALKLVYDTRPPDPPGITGSSAQDQAARVSFSADQDTATVLIEVQGAGEPDFRQAGEAPVANGFVRATGLTNGTTYDVRLRARDSAGNVSLPSELVSLTPVLTLGFWGYYKQQGGTDSQGCSVGFGLVPAALALWTLRRLRKQGRNRS